ncbi:hypothetical protein [Desulfogranum japonicum]|uniref:hypothetical protein n=1 Tax=Desulfogranum japonicum TaxID=231447 RepID=UPI0004061686|nr:hypothetical protein [Desulfogranum japonicum]
MRAYAERLMTDESGQGATEYMVFLVFAITLCFIGFLFVPYFTDGFDVLLSRILGSNYYLSSY